MIPKDATCKTCGWFDGDKYNPSHLGICSDPSIVLGSPTGRTTEVVRDKRKACTCWIPKEEAAQ